MQRPRSRGSVPEARTRNWPDPFAAAARTAPLHDSPWAEPSEAHRVAAPDPAPRRPSHAAADQLLRRLREALSAGEEIVPARPASPAPPTPPLATLPQPAGPSAAERLLSQLRESLHAPDNGAGVAPPTGPAEPVSPAPAPAIPPARPAQKRTRPAAPIPLARRDPRPKGPRPVPLAAANDDVPSKAASPETAAPPPTIAPPAPTPPPEIAARRLPGALSEQLQSPLRSPWPGLTRPPTSSFPQEWTRGSSPREGRLRGDANPVETRSSRAPDHKPGHRASDEPSASAPVPADPPSSPFAAAESPPPPITPPPLSITQDELPRPAAETPPPLPPSPPRPTSTEALLERLRDAVPPPERPAGAATPLPEPAPPQRVGSGRWNGRAGAAPRRSRSRAHLWLLAVAALAGLAAIAYWPMLVAAYVASYPGEPTRREALRACSAENPTFVRFFAAERDLCYERMTARLAAAQSASLHGPR
jgi:hypothetical protein